MRPNKKSAAILFPVAGACLAFFCGVFLFAFAGCGKDLPRENREYGVFLGIGGGERDRLEDYRIVVIEPSEFRAGEIAELRAGGKEVYGYINVGAIEKYRPYYDRFRHLTLGVYENWPDEEWIDVSAPEWREFIVNELGKQYAGMGLDGFFLDNADVYFHYGSDEVFQGLSAILTGLRGHGIPLIINGGDVFVTRCMEEGTARTLFDGVSQETVFTGIDFEKGTCGPQDESETAYFQEYLAGVKNSGLSVWLLEYGADPALEEEIARYCRANGFLWYNAEDPRLR